jgi:hypothetical protein
VQRAQADGYRSRACYKLLELNEKYRFIKPGMTGSRSGQCTRWLVTGGRSTGGP